MKAINTSKTNWDLTPLFKSDDDPLMKTKREYLKKASYDFINKWKDRTDYLENPEILKEALDEFEYLTREYAGGGDEGYYFALKSNLNQNDPEIKARAKKVSEMAKQISNDIQFFTYRISKIPEKEQLKFTESPHLKDYSHFLENLFKEAKYLLTEDEEKILTLVSSTSAGNWVRMVSSLLAKQEREILTEDGTIQPKVMSEITDLLNSKDKKVRDSAAVAFNEILASHADIAESEMNSLMEFKKTVDNLRKVERPDLLRHLDDDIETEVVDALLESVEKKYEISSRYYELKAKLFGVPVLQYHERNVEYGDTEKTYTWEQTVELVHKVFRNLDSEFSEIFKDFVEKGQIDVFPKKGKTSGAFCISYLTSQPVYVLLNHTNKLDNVTTLAHEMGHAINDVLMIRKQNALNASTPLSTAEVASTFMEDFVLQELWKEADEETRLSLMVSKLNDDISTIIRQVAAYRFEQELHSVFREKGYLSKEEIGRIFQKHMSAYMGPFVEQTVGAENWWVYWGHFRSSFYVYSYASGLLISKSLQNSVKNDPEFIEKVKEFLSSGSYDSPKNIFADLGVDITDKSFWDRGLEEVEQLLKDTEDLAKKLGKV